MLGATLSGKRTFELGSHTVGKMKHYALDMCISELTSFLTSSNGMFHPDWKACVEDRNYCTDYVPVIFD